MALLDDIQALRDRTLAGLDASHDYYTYTKRVWRLLQQVVGEGRRFRFRNLTTGSTVDERSLVGRSRLYISEFLAASTFQQFVSQFEDFFFDLLRLWLVSYPGSLKRKQVDLATVLDAPDKQGIVLAVVDKQLNELKYERLQSWFEYLETLVKLGCPTAGDIERLAEIKASRDILVHNQGIANKAYLAKSGSRARCNDGEKLELPEQYHRESWETIRRVVEELAAAAQAKAERGPSS